jgi:uncharacterized protein (TIGR02284 family)
MFDHAEHAMLNRLVETCRDGEQGFRLAAERVTDPGLKALFTELAEQRATFAVELLPHAQRLGGNAPAEGTSTGRLHRSWMAIEGWFRREDHAIVAEVERGDRTTLRLYFEALDGMLPPDARDVVQRQCDELEEAHARIPVREAIGK